MKNITWIILIAAAFIGWYLYKKNKTQGTIAAIAATKPPISGGTTATGTVSQPTGTAKPQPYVFPALPSTIWAGMDEKKTKPHS